MSHPAAPHPDRPRAAYDPRALVGWRHRDLAHGIELELQSAHSRIGLENDQIASTHILMTRNQALLLARYLLGVTGQTLAPEPARGSWWRGLLGRRSADRP